MRRAALIVMHRGSPSPKVEVGHVAPGQAPLVGDAPHDGRAVVAEQHDAVELVLDDGARLRARDAEDERELLVAELRRDVARVASPNSQPVSWEEAIVYSYQYLVSKLDDDEYPIPWLNKPRCGHGVDMAENLQAKKRKRGKRPTRPAGVGGSPATQYPQSTAGRLRERRAEPPGVARETPASRDAEGEAHARRYRSASH